MPELGELRPRGIQPIVFTPASPASYFDRRLPDAPDVDTSALSKSQAIGAIAKTIGTLPEQVLQSYNRGYNIGRAREASNDPNAEVSYGPDGTMSVKPMSKMTAELTQAKIENEQADAALKKSLVGNDAFSQIDRAYVAGGSGQPVSTPYGSVTSTPPKKQGARPMESFGTVEPDLPVLTNDIGLPSTDAVDASTPNPANSFPMASFGVEPVAPIDSTTPQLAPAPPAISKPIGKEGTPSLIPGLEETAPKPDGMVEKRPTIEPVPGMIGADGKPSAYYHRPNATTTFMVVKGRKDPIQIHEPAKTAGAAFDTSEQLDAYHAEHGLTVSKRVQDADGKWHALEVTSQPKLSKPVADELASARLNGFVYDASGKTDQDVAKALSDRNADENNAVIPLQNKKEFTRWELALSRDPVVKDYLNAHSQNNVVKSALADGATAAGATAAIDSFTRAMSGKGATIGMTHILEDSQSLLPKLRAKLQGIIGDSGENSKITPAMANDIKNIIGRVDEVFRKEVEAQMAGQKQRWKGRVGPGAITNAYAPILGNESSIEPVLPESEKPSVPTPSPDSADPVASAQDRAMAFTNKRTSEISELLSDYSSGKFDSSPENKAKAERVLRANGAIK